MSQTDGSESQGQPNNEHISSLGQNTTAAHGSSHGGEPLNFNSVLLYNCAAMSFQTQ